MEISTALPVAPVDESTSIVQPRVTRLHWKGLSSRVALWLGAIVLPMTLLSSAAHALSLSRGNLGSDVTELQQRLNQRGYSIKVDGDYGGETEQAVRDFQLRSRDLYPSGIADDPTLQALGFRSGNIVAPSPSTFGRCASSGGDRSSRDAFGGKRYVVVIPTDNARTLSEVRRYCQGAYAVRSQLGSYVAVASFFSRGEAEAWSEYLKVLSSRDAYLKAVGFRDAHVRYF